MANNLLELLAQGHSAAPANPLQELLDHFRANGASSGVHSNPLQHFGVGVPQAHPGNFSLGNLALHPGRFNPSNLLALLRAMPHGHPLDVPVPQHPNEVNPGGPMIPARPADYLHALGQNAAAAAMWRQHHTGSALPPNWVTQQYTAQDQAANPGAIRARPAQAY